MKTIGAQELPVLVGLLSGMPAFNDFRAAYARLSTGRGCCGKGRPLGPPEHAALAAHFRIGAMKAGLQTVYRALSALYGTGKEPIRVSLARGQETILNE